MVDPYLRDLQKRSDLTEKQRTRVALALLPYVRADQYVYSLSREQLAKLRGVPCHPIKDDTPLPIRLGGRAGAPHLRSSKAGRDTDTSCPL